MDWCIYLFAEKLFPVVLPIVIYVSIEECKDEIKNLVFIVPIPWKMLMNEALCNLKISQLVLVEYPILAKTRLLCAEMAGKITIKTPKFFTSMQQIFSVASALFDRETRKF